MKSQQIAFQKSQKLLAENLHDRLPIQNIKYNYSFNFKGGVCNSHTGYCTKLRDREASSFCDFCFVLWPLAISDYTLFKKNLTHLSWWLKWAIAGRGPYVKSNCFIFFLMKLMVGFEPNVAGIIPRGQGFKVVYMVHVAPIVARGMASGFQGPKQCKFQSNIFFRPRSRTVKLFSIQIPSYVKT